VDVLVEALQIGSYFDAILSGEKMPAKPDPSLFLLAAGQIGVEPRRCIVVEDSLVGIGAARGAGMKCIAVANTHAVEKLKDAQLVTRSLVELPDDAFQRLLEQV
jgi:beta-phosphoglucomutase-like phosphatase (HAD superfamily)